MQQNKQFYRDTSQSSSQFSTLKNPQPDKNKKPDKFYKNQSG